MVFLEISTKGSRALRLWCRRLAHAVRPLALLSGRRCLAHAVGPLALLSDRRWLSYMIGALALLLYVPRCFRTLAVIGDSAELVTAAIVRGVPHAPGYPLYTALGHVLSHLHLGERLFPLHLASAVFHAGAVVAVVDAAITITASPWAGVTAGLALTLSRSFFLGSLYAEVFPLNDLWFAILLAIGIRISRARTSRPRQLWLFSALAGIASAHHLMTGLAIPALLLLVGPAFAAALKRAPLRLPGWILLAIGPFAVGYPLMLLFARGHPIVSWGEIHDWPSFWHVAARQDYGGLFRASARTVSGQALERLDLFVQILTRSFGVLAVLGLVGAGVTLRRGGTIGWAPLLAFLIPGPVFACLNAFDIRSEYRAAYFERFATMSHIAFAILISIGIAHLSSLLTQRPWVGRMTACTGIPRLWLSRIPVVCLILPLTSHADRLDLSTDRTGAAYARDLVTGTPANSVILLAGDMAAQAAMYACGVEKLCGNRIVLSPGQLHMGWVLAQINRKYPDLARMLGSTELSSEEVNLRTLIETILESRPVYLHPELLRKHTSLASRFVLVPELLLLRAYGSRADMANDSALKSRYEAIATGNGCAGCTAPRASVWHPSMQGQLLSAYADGLRQQARAASELGWPLLTHHLDRLALIFSTEAADADGRPK